MGIEILTVDRLARHVLYQQQNLKWPKLYTPSRKMILSGMGDLLTYSIGVYYVEIRPETRLLFQQGPFKADHPKLYMAYLAPTPASHVIVTGPAADLEDIEDALLKTTRRKGYLRHLIEQQLGPEEELRA